MQRLVVVGKATLVVALVQPDHSAIAPAAGIGRRDPGRLAIVGGGAIELLGIAVDIAAVDVGKRAGPELDLHGVIGERMDGVALALIGVAAIAIGDGERWVVFDGGVEVGQRAVKVALTQPGVAAVVVGQCKRRIDADRLVIIGHGVVEIALEGVDATTIGVSAGIGRIDPDRLIEVGQRGIELALFGEAVAAVAIGAGELLARLRLAVDHGTAGRHPVVGRGGGTDAALPELLVPGLVAFGRCGRRVHECQGCAQQRCGQAGQNTHSGNPCGRFPFGRGFARAGSKA